MGSSPRAALVLCWALTLCGPARADPPAPPVDVTAGKIHYDAGRRLYEAKRYREALHEFEAAYQSSGRAALLYNMGRCHEQLGDEKEAIRAYEDFLAEDKGGPERANVERHVQALRERVWSMEQGLAQPKEVRRPMRRYPFVIGGLGLALLAASIGPGVVAQQRENTLLEQCPELRCGDDPIAREVRDQGRALAISTDVLLAVGGAATLTGIITVIIEARRAAR